MPHPILEHFISASRMTGSGGHACNYRQHAYICRFVLMTIVTVLISLSCFVSYWGWHWLVLETASPKAMLVNGPPRRGGAMLKRSLNIIGGSTTTALPSPMGTTETTGTAETTKKQTTKTTTKTTTTTTTTTSTTTAAAAAAAAGGEGEGEKTPPPPPTVFPFGWETMTEFSNLQRAFSKETSNVGQSSTSSSSSSSSFSASSRRMPTPAASSSTTTMNSSTMTIQRHRPFASEFLGGQPVYMSMTTIRGRIFGVPATIESIVQGTIWPDHIFVFVSKEPYLLDDGVTPAFLLVELKVLLQNALNIYPYISIVFTENLGPHRKLLPLLAKKWDEDCAIVTIDDHEIYRSTVLEQLLRYYEASGRGAVVALRARRMGICHEAPPWRLAPYTRSVKGSNGTRSDKGQWPESVPGRREMLLLPTGTGGVLYRPRFFHPIVFDRRLINLTRTGDDLMFRLAVVVMGVPVVTACAERDALGRPCPPSPPPSWAGIGSAVPPIITYTGIVERFTFEHNFTRERNEGMLRSPGVAGRWRSGSRDTRESSSGPLSSTAAAAAPATTTTLDEAVGSIGAKGGSRESAKAVDIAATATTAATGPAAAEDLEIGKGRRDIERRATSSPVNPQKVNAGAKGQGASAVGGQGPSEGELSSSSSSLLRWRPRKLRPVQTQQQQQTQLGDKESDRKREGGSESSLYTAAAPSYSAAAIREGHQVGQDEQQEQQDQHQLQEQRQQTEQNEVEQKQKEVQKLLSVPWEDDSRKKTSLATLYNNAGGNNAMWARSVAFLLEQEMLDVDGLVQVLAPLERQQCLLSAAVTKPQRRSHRQQRAGKKSKASSSLLAGLWATYDSTGSDTGSSSSSPSSREHSPAASVTPSAPPSSSAAVAASAIASGLLSLRGVMIAVQGLYDPECGLCVCEILPPLHSRPASTTPPPLSVPTVPQTDSEQHRQPPHSQLKNHHQQQQQQQQPTHARNVMLAAESFDGNEDDGDRDDIPPPPKPIMMPFYIL